MSTNAVSFDFYKVIKYSLYQIFNSKSLEIVIYYLRNIVNLSDFFDIYPEIWTDISKNL
jgi:hypothetical protein